MRKTLENVVVRLLPQGNLLVAMEMWRGEVPPVPRLCACGCRDFSVVGSCHVARRPLLCHLVIVTFPSHRITLNSFQLVSIFYFIRKLELGLGPAKSGWDTLHHLKFDNVRLLPLVLTSQARERPSIDCTQTIKYARPSEWEDRTDQHGNQTA